MVMGQGNFYLMDNDLKFTIIWELAYFPKSTEPQINRSVDFISGRSYYNHKNSQISQNFRSIAVLHVSLASLQTEKTFRIFR